MSISYPEIKSLFDSIFSLSASAVDSFIMNYAPSGTRDLAVDASVSASSSYNSGDGHWDLSRINDGTMTYNGGTNGYNGEAGFTSSPDEKPRLQNQKQSLCQLTLTLKAFTMLAVLRFSDSALSLILLTSRLQLTVLIIQRLQQKRLRRLQRGSCLR